MTVKGAVLAAPYLFPCIAIAGPFSKAISSLTSVPFAVISNTGASQFGGLMKYAIVFSSKTGNTASLADRIEKTLGADCCIYKGTPDDKAYEADTLYIGFWTYMGSCGKDIEKFISSTRNKNIFLFGTAGFGGSDAYFSAILANVAKCIDSSCKLIGTYMCQGRMPMAVREKYLKMDEQKAKPMIENFDRALTHPDENDFKGLERAIRS